MSRAKNQFQKDKVILLVPGLQTKLLLTCDGTHPHRRAESRLQDENIGFLFCLVYPFMDYSPWPVTIFVTNKYSSSSRVASYPTAMVIPPTEDLPNPSGTY